MEPAGVEPAGMEPVRIEPAGMEPVRIEPGMILNTIYFLLYALQNPVMYFTKFSKV